MKILIVDDEEAARYGMSRALRNYTIAEAASVDEARRRVSAEKPDLIILDINLPGMSGLEYLKELSTQGDGTAGHDDHRPWLRKEQQSRRSKAELMTILPNRSRSMIFG
ncbi:MAG: response regulator [Acidobacteria bacterium]|nr:response regulator [Acidobacteriota bacterium]